MEFSQSVSELIEHLGRLPGIGRKSAERLAYHLLRTNKAEALALADAIRSVRENVHYCAVCFNLAEGELCNICADPRRDQTLLCVVEQPRDLIALEQASAFRGLYHVLLGRVSPLEGVGPEQLTISQLVERVRRGNFTEIIMGTNPTVEGDGTALYISNQLSEFPIEVTRPGPRGYKRQHARTCQQGYLGRRTGWSSKVIKSYCGVDELSAPAMGLYTPCHSCGLSGTISN